MTNAIPIRVVVDGSGDTTGLSEFRTNETVGLDHGGTGATNAADARTNLGLSAIAASGSWTDLLNKPNTDDIPEGTTNLYFTDERVDDRVAALIVDGVGIQKNYDDAGNLLNIEINFSEFDTDDIIEGSVNTFLANRSTSDIPEGTNLYFTDERVDDRVANLFVDGKGIQKSYDDAGNLLNIAIDFSEFDTDDIVEGTVNTFLSNRTTDDINEGTVNLYYTDERVDDRVANLFVDGKGLTKNYDDAGNLLNVEIDFSEFDSDDIVEGAVNTFLANRTTDNIPEGSTNLYFTETRSRNSISATGSINYDPATGVISYTQGDTDTIVEGATNLYYTDERVDDRVANLILDGQGITKSYDDAGNLLNIAIDFTEFDSDDIIEGAVNTFLASRTTDNIPEGSTNLYYTEARFDARLATKSTTDLAEGTNLYFTEERVDDRVAALIQAGEDISVVYDDVANTLTIALASSIDGINLSNNTTDDLSEGSTNLYYTDSRVNIAFDTRLATKSTTDLSEGTNLYYTDARVDSNFAAKTTTDLAEGTNLYYTDTRVATYLNNNGYTTTSAVAAQIASVSSDLDDEIYDREQADLNLQSQIDNLVLNDLTDVNASSPTSGDALVWNGTSWVPQAPFSQTDFDSAFAAKTTTDLTEGTNLYYTDARVRSHVEGQDLDLGSNKILFSNVYANIGDLPSASSYHGMFAHVHGTGKAYYAHAGNWIELANNTDLPTSTDDLPEGSTNLYYTDTRVRSAISATTGVAGYVSSTGVFSIPSSTDHISEGTNLYYTDARFDARLATKSTTDLTEGTNLYYTDARVDANIASKTTDDITEGTTNLYYTDARVATYISGNRTYGNITTTGYIAGPSTLTIDPAGVGDNTGKVVIAGDLQVDGTTTTINSTTVEVDDLNIVLGSGATNAAAANGGGITIDLGADGSATFTYNSTTDEFLSNKDINANITGQVSDISNHTTTDLAEGTNLYYTQSRFDTAFGAKSTTDLTEGTNLYYTDARVDANIAAKTTDNIAEGITNLYYTQARFDTAFAAKDTDGLTEGSTNLYYTDARVNTWATANLANVAFSGSYADLSNTPTDLSDFTDATGLLDVAAITVGDVAPSNPNDGDLWFDSTELKTFIYYNDGTSSQWVEAAGDGGASVQSSSTAPSSPSDGDLWFNDNNLKLYIYYNDGSSAQWVEASGGIAQDTDAIPEGNNNLYYTDTRFDTRFATKDTDDLVEGSTNLYYTDARVDARIASSSLGSTDDLPEGSTNLYYTDARVQSVSINEVVEDTTPTLGGNLNANTFNITNISADGYSLPVADGTNRQVIMTDGSGTLSFENLDTIHTEVTNQTGSTILKGTPVYQTGTSGNSMTIAPADASSSATMPAVGVLEQDLVSGATGFVIHMGKISGVDTSAFNEGDTIYVAVGGGYTNTPPVGESNLLQNLGRVTKVHASNGGGVIMGAGRTNAVPNLNDGNIFIGDSNNQAITTSLNTSVQNYLSNLSGSIVPDTNVTYDLGSNTNRFKDIYLSGSSIYLGTLQLSDNNGALEVTASGSTEAFATETYVDTAVANLVDSSPTTLDTLNELAAALGDDPNFSTTITNLIGTKLATSDFNTTADSWLTGKTTTDLTEGTNLYYTDVRVDARIALQTGANLSLANKTTDDLSEGSANLYYTDARVETYLESNATADRIQLRTNNSYFGVGTAAGSAGMAIKNNSGQPFFYGQKYLPANNGQTDLELEANAGGKINVNAFRIYNVGTPTDPSDAATKSYVDSAIATKDQLSELSGTTDDISEGSTNLYYTDARVDARITASNPYDSSDFDTDFSGKSTTDLTEGTNLYYTDARVDARITASNPYDSSDFDANFSGKSTTDLTEGTNLYYTDARADARVANANIGVLNDVNTTGIATGDFLLYDGSEFLPVDFATEVNTYADARINTASIQDLSDVDAVDTPASGDVLLYDAGNSNFGFINLGNEINSYFDTRFATKDTDDLTEGTTNLYYTDARVASYLSGTGYATTSYVAAQIASISSDLDDEVYDREQADLNLQSQIDSLTTNIGTLVLDDLSDVDTTTTAPTNGQTLIFNGTTFVPGTISGYTSTDFDTDFGTKSTTDLSEGTNLYYTDARVRTHIQGADLDMGSNKILFSNVYANTGDLPSASSYHGMFAHVHGTGKAYYAHNGQWVELANVSELPTNTDDVSEGSTNLYYTDARFDARLATKSTTDVVEGTNLYYTDARVDARITASNPYDSSDFDTDFGTKSTTDLSEGTNLYYTDARVQSYLTAQGIAAETLTSLGIAGNVLTYTDEDGNTTNIDLSLYLDDTNLARLVSGTLNGTTGIATFTRDDATTFTIDFSPLFDDTNLSRINSATFTNGTLTLTRDDASTAATISLDGRYLQDLSGLTTDNLSEGSTNLYYTQTRFNSAFAGKTTTDLTEGTNLYYTDTRFDTRLATKSTTDLTEGTNLYYTDARVDARIAAANIVSGSSIDDLSDVDTSTTTPTDGQALVWDNTNSKWVPGASASGSSIDVSDIAPSNPSDGDLWFDSSELKTYIYYNDGTSSQWVEAAGNVASNVHLSDAAPSSPSEGDLWFNSSNLRLYVYYNDGNSSQWIEASGSVNSTGQTSLDDLTDVDITTTAPTNGQTLVFNGTNFVPGTVSGYATSDFNTDFATKDTDDLTEGSTNLYYTDSRVQTKLGDVSGHIIPDTDVTYDLGSSTHKFRDLYLSGNSITLGGIVLTEHSGALQVHTTGGGAAQPFATVSYVDTELANLVSSAPTTLDTLNELAAALGDDPNFATTITNLIGTKLAITDFNTTADSWLTTKSTTGLSEGTNLYYTDARVRSHVEGQDLDLGTNKVLFSNMYATIGDLPSAASYHGMFAHVHATGKAYYAHGGSWIELANVSEVFDGTWASLTGTPTTIAGYGITDAFDGDYNSLTNKPSVPSALDDLTDVDLTTTSPTDGQALIWDSVNSVWKPGNVASGGGGGASVSVSDTAPSSPSVGDLWFNSANTKMYVYFNDGTSSQWIQSNPSGATSPIISSDTAPTNPVVNSLWFDSSDGSLYFRYDDGSSEQWVNLIDASLSGGGGGASVTVSDTAPTSPSAGDMWFDSQYATLLIYYNDGTNSQWVSVSGENNSTSTPQWQEQSADYTASAGDKLFVDCSSSAVTVTLPSSPSQGDEVRIIDATGNASINNITINRNGSNIQGAADNLIIETDRAAFGLVYYNATQGWLLMER